MRQKKDIDSRISRMCKFALTDEDEMERLGSTLLETFHDVCMHNTDAAEELVEELLYPDSAGDDPATS